VEIENYWKLVIGATLGISLIIFGLAFWNSATEDYTSHLNDKTYEITSCQACRRENQEGYSSHWESLRYGELSTPTGII